MNIMDRIHRRVIDPNNPLYARRPSPYEWMISCWFRRLPKMRVLDLGGSPDYWRNSPERPAHVTTVNLEQFEADEPWITHVVGDACNMAILDQLDGEFDMAMTTNLLNRVTGYGRHHVANVVTVAAPRHWAQLNADRLRPRTDGAKELARLFPDSLIFPEFLPRLSRSHIAVSRLH